MSGSVQASWTYTDAELQDFAELVLRRSSAGYRGGLQIVFAFAALAIATGFAAVALGAVPDVRDPTVTILCIAILFAARAIDHRLIKRFWSKVQKERIARTLESQWSVEIDEIAVSMTSQHGFWRFAWPAIIEVTSARGLVVFWVDLDRGVVVPRRAFTDSDVERLSTFVAIVRDREKTG